MHINRFVSAVILAAGSGSRMNSVITKQKIELLGQTVIKRTVSAFSRASSVAEIIVVVREDELEFMKAELLSYTEKKIKFAIGGATRCESAFAGARLAEAEFVAIHDAARCLITSDMIDKIAEAAQEFGAATAAYRITDTVKRSSGDFIYTTVDRNGLYAVQTPQIFNRDAYTKAANTVKDPSIITDDNMVMENTGVSIKLIDIGRENIKITTEDDLAYAEYVLEKRRK